MCIQVSFPQIYIGVAAEVSITDNNAVMAIVASDGEGGYYSSGRPVIGNEVHEICLYPAEANIALFTIPGGFPTGYSAENAVVKVTGICTIDNIPAPQGSGEG